MCAFALNERKDLRLFKRLNTFFLAQSPNFPFKYTAYNGWRRHMSARISTICAPRLLLHISSNKFGDRSKSLSTKKKTQMKKTTRAKKQNLRHTTRNRRRRCGKNQNNNNIIRCVNGIVDVMRWLPMCCITVFVIHIATKFWFVLLFVFFFSAFFACHLAEKKTRETRAKTWWARNVKLPLK